MQFRNHYHCAEWGCEWTGVWSAQCDDDCPHCGARHFLTVGDPSQVKQLSQQTNKRISPIRKC
jgi:hypothetical protein